MGKSRRNRGSSLKNIAKGALPAVDKGLRTVGKTANAATKASLPIIEKGVSVVYDTMSTGFDLGKKGVSSVTRKARSLAGGRRRRRRGSRRHRRH